MADDTCRGSFKNEQTGRSGLAFPLQSAAKRRIPEKIQLQQFQQEPASEGIQWMIVLL